MIFGSKLLQAGIRAEYDKAYRDISNVALDYYSTLRTYIASTRNQETYAWLGDLPAFREWVGERHIPTPKDWGYTLINKDYESTFSVDRNEVEDDQIESIMVRARDLAIKARNVPSKLISSLVQNGTTNLAYDGVAFFSDATGVRKIDNLLAGTGVTLAQVESDLANARQSMLTYLDDNGEPLGVIGDTVICPPAMEMTFRKLIQSTTAAGQANANVINPFSAMVKGLVVDYRLTDSNDWYLVSSNGALKPFIYQGRKDPQFVALDKPDDDNVFMKKKIFYGVDLRGAAGYTFPQLACKVVN